MPFTFSTEALQRPLADFGNDAAAMILQTGKQIEQGLQTMMTNRQVAGLGQELGTLNPESPEWAQQAVKLGSRYPLAMKSPAGQFMLSTQAKANAQWQQTQRATAQADTMMRRQVGLENLRTANDVRLKGIRSADSLAVDARQDDGVDLLGAGAQPVQRNPAQGISLETGGMSGAAQGAMNAAAPEEGALLTGMTGSLPDISGRALSPLAAAQQATGVKPTRAQVFSAISQEDRQMQQEKVAADREATKAITDEKKAAATAKEAGLRESRFERGQQRLLLQNQLSSIDREISQHRKALENHEKGGGDSEEFFARKKDLQSNLEQAGKEQTRLKRLLEKIGEEDEEKTRIIERNGKKYEVDDDTKQVLREVK